MSDVVLMFEQEFICQPDKMFKTNHGDKAAADTTGTIVYTDFGPLKCVRVRDWPSPK